MAELLATTPHATCPVLRSGTQKVSPRGCCSNPEVEDGTNRTGDTAQQPFLGETVEAPSERTLSRPQAPMPAFLSLPPVSYPHLLPQPALSLQPNSPPGKHLLPNTLLAATVQLTKELHLYSPHAPALPQSQLSCFFSSCP